MIKLIKLKLLDSDIIFIDGQTPSKKEFKNFLKKKNLSLYFSKESIKKACKEMKQRSLIVDAASTIVVNTRIPIIYLSSFTGDLDTKKSVVVHEVLHALFYIFDAIGVSLTYDTQEIFCYTIQYITNKIFKLCNKKT